MGKSEGMYSLNMDELFVGRLEET